MALNHFGADHFAAQHFNTLRRSGGLLHFDQEYFRGAHFAAHHFSLLRRSVRPGTTIGGGVGRGGGVSRRELRKTTEELLNLLFREQITPEIAEKVQKAVEKTLEMERSDQFSTQPAEEARQAVEQAWMDLQAQKLQLETKFALDEIKWLLTLQQELSILYGIIDDEEAAIVLLMSV